MTFDDGFVKADLSSLPFVIRYRGLDERPWCVTKSQLIFIAFRWTLRRLRCHYSQEGEPAIMQRICAGCSETITDAKSNSPLEFDSADSISLCESCEEQKQAREASTGVPWDVYFDCPAGSDREQ
jgi:hypothetical protein